MPDIQTCMMDALKKTKQQAALLEAQTHLLEHVCHEVTVINGEQPKPCGAVFDEWLFTVDELFTLLKIHECKRSEFDKKMESWKSYHYLIGDKSYFPLFKLIKAAAFLTDIMPLTIYFLSLQMKGDLRST
jgi:hypothetical protein